MDRPGASCGGHGSGAPISRRPWRRAPAKYAAVTKLAVEENTWGSCAGWNSTTNDSDRVDAPADRTENSNCAEWGPQPFTLTAVTRPWNWKISSDVERGMAAGVEGGIGLCRTRPARRMLRRPGAWRARRECSRTGRMHVRSARRPADRSLRAGGRSSSRSNAGRASRPPWAHTAHRPHRPGAAASASAGPPRARSRGPCAGRRRGLRRRPAA